MGADLISDSEDSLGRLSQDPHRFKAISLISKCTKHGGLELNRIGASANTRPFQSSDIVMHCQLASRIVPHRVVLPKPKAPALV